MANSTIRPYAPADRAAVLRIAADTAAFGAPAEAFLDDRRPFEDAMYRYYVNFEPEHAWVAVADGDVRGFLMGCVDTRRHDRYVARKIVPALAANLLRGRYRIGRRTIRHVLAEIEAAIRREFPTVDLDLYPAHLHINLDASWRGQGAGSALMDAYLRQLRSLAVAGVHLRTTSLNAAAVALYTRFGFELLDARPTHLWKQITNDFVENRCYGLRLG